MKCSFKLIACSVLATASLSSFAATSLSDVTAIGTDVNAGTFDSADLAPMALDSTIAVIIQKSANPGTAVIDQNVLNPNVAVIVQDLQSATGQPVIAYINQPESSSGNVAYINQK